MTTLNFVNINGFKSIRELKDFELRQLNVMIGANGAGKSNFLKLFEFLYRAVSKQLPNYSLRMGGPETFLYFGRKITPYCTVKLGFREGEIPFGYELRASPSVNGSMILDHEGYSTGTEVIQYLTNARPYHFGDTSDSARVKQIGDIGDNAALRQDGGNLAAFLYLLQNHFPAHYQLIVETIRLVAPFFGDFALRPLPENPNKIRLEWRDNGSDDYLDASYLSDGTLRLICLTTLLSQPKLPALVIIDEPELGLHPSAINLLADMLAGAATKTQVLVSTQSVTLVNQFQPDDIIVVDRENGNSTFKRLDADELSDWLIEYTLGELWEKNIFGGRP